MLVKMYSTGIILLLTITIGSAAQIEGFWQVDRSNDIIEIRSTRDGIKAKFVDRGEWENYEYLRQNIYEDRRGNRYIFRSDEDLKWESRDNRRVVNLRKSYNSGDENHYHDDGWDNDYYDDRNNRQGRSGNYDNNRNIEACGPSCGHNCVHVRNRKVNRADRYLVNQLSGTYSNGLGTRLAYVDYDGFVLRMKTNRARGWTNYRRTHHRKLEFEDRFGNSVRFKNNGELRWRRGDGGRTLTFRKRY